MPNAVCTATLLLVLGVLRTHAFIPSFSPPCTGDKPVCVCDDEFPDCYPFSTPDSDLVCGNNYNATEVNNALDSLDSFCQSDCALAYYQCLLDNPDNENCTDDARIYRAMCSYYSEDELCWRRFVSGVSQQEFQCDDQTCLDISSSEACINETGCVNQLNSASSFLSCCAATLFSVCPFEVGFATDDDTYGYCNVTLEPACPSPSPSSLTSETPSPSLGNETPSTSMSPLLVATPASSAPPTAPTSQDSPATTAAGGPHTSTVSITLVLLVACLALYL